MHLFSKNLIPAFFPQFMSLLPNVPKISPSKPPRNKRAPSTTRRVIRTKRSWRRSTTPSSSVPWTRVGCLLGLNLDGMILPKSDIIGVHRWWNKIFQGDFYTLVKVYTLENGSYGHRNIFCVFFCHGKMVMFHIVVLVFPEGKWM